MRIWGVLFSVGLILVPPFAFSFEKQAPAYLQKSIDDLFQGPESNYTGLADIFKQTPTAQQNYKDPLLIESLFFDLQPGLIDRPISFYPTNMAETYERADEVRKEFYQGIIDEFPQRDTPYQRAIRGISDLRSTLRLHTMTPERTSSSRTQQQIDSETNNRFFSKYGRARNDSSPDDRRDFLVMRNRVELEELEPRIKWSKQTPVQFEELKKKLIRQVTQITSDYELAVLKELAPFTEEFNEASRVIHFRSPDLEPPPNPNHYALNLLDDKNIITKVPFDSYSVAKIYTDPETGELSYKDESSGKVLKLMSSHPMSLYFGGEYIKRIHHDFNPFEQYIRFLRSKEQSSDPKWVLKTPKFLSEKILERAVDESQINSLRYAKNYLSAAKSIEFLESAVDQLEKTHQNAKGLNIDREVFESVAESTHAAFTGPQHDLPNHYKIATSANPHFPLSRLLSKTKINPREIGFLSMRRVLWSKLQDPNDSWLMREEAAERKKLPHFNTAITWSNRLEAAKRVAYNGGQHAKRYTKGFAAGTGILSLAAGILRMS